MTTRQCCPCKRRGRTFRERRKSNSRPTSCSEDGSIVELCKWMKAAAGFKCPLSPANFQDTGRGLKTKSTIRSGEIIIALPKKLLITNQTAFQSDIGLYLKKWRPLLLPQACLSIFLLWERRKLTDSHWFPYINSLPATFNTPPYLTDKEISCLPDSVQKSAFKEKWKVSTVYKQIESHCKLHWTELFDILDFETFRWCWSVINTRSVYLDGGLSEYLNMSEPNNIALAPYLDLINHSPSARIKADYNSMSGCYEITTYDCYRPYDQVFISYGFHSNGRLLVDYGFCVPGNHCDEVQISEEEIRQACLKENISYLEKKMDILKNNALLGCFQCRVDGIAGQFWIAVEVLVSSWEDLPHWYRLLDREVTAQNASWKAVQLLKAILKEYLADLDVKQACLTQVIEEMGTTDRTSAIASLLAIERAIISSALTS